MSYRVDVRSFRRPDQPQPVYPQVVDAIVAKWAGVWSHEAQLRRTDGRPLLDVRYYKWDSDSSTGFARTVDTTVRTWIPIFDTANANYRPPARPPLEVRWYDWDNQFRSQARIVDPIVATWSPSWPSRWDRTLGRAGVNVLDWRPELAWIFQNLPSGSTVAQQWPAICQLLNTPRMGARSGLPISADFRDIANWIFGVQAGPSTAQLWPGILQSLLSYRVAGRDLLDVRRYNWDANFNFQAKIVDPIVASWLPNWTDGRTGERTNAAPLLDVRRYDWDAEFNFQARIVDPIVASWLPAWNAELQQFRTGSRPVLEGRHLTTPDLAWIFQLIPAITVAQMWPAILLALGTNYRVDGRALLDVRRYDWDAEFNFQARIVDPIVASWAGVWEHGQRSPDRFGFDGRLLTTPDLAWIFKNLPSGLTVAQMWPAIWLGVQPGYPTPTRATLDSRLHDLLERSWENVPVDAFVAQLAAILSEESQQFRTGEGPKLDVRQHEWFAKGWVNAPVDAILAKFVAIWNHEVQQRRTDDRAKLDVRGHEWNPEFTWTQKVVDSVVARWAPIFDAERSNRTPSGPQIDVRQDTWETAIGWWFAGIIIYPQLVRLVNELLAMPLIRTELFAKPNAINDLFAKPDTKNDDVDMT